MGLNISLEQTETIDYGLTELTTGALFTELGKIFEDSKPYSREYLNSLGCGMQDYLCEKTEDAIQYRAALVSELLKRGVSISFLDNSGVGNV